MLSNISWTDYIIAVVVSTIIYYLFIALRYYSTELKELLSGKRSLYFRGANNSAEIADENSNLQRHPFENTMTENKVGDEYLEVEHLIERLKNVIEDPSGKNVNKDELKEYLSLVLIEFPSLKNSPLRSSINELIVSECSKYSAVALSEDEVDLLWLD